MLAVAVVATACGGTPAASPAVSAGGSAAATAKPAPVKVSLGYASVSATQASAWVAKETGIFDKYGLDVTLENIPGGSSPTAALIANDIQGLQISVEAMSADLEGADIEYVAAPVSSPLFWFVSQPSIKTADDLRGKKVAATTVGSATYFADVLALQKLGLDISKDVQLLAVNNVPAILAAIQTGQVAAGAVSMPTYSEAKKAGLNTLVNVPDLGFKYPSSWLAVRRSWADGHKDTVSALVKSITEAISYELKHPTETQQIIGKYSKLTDAALLKESYDTLAPYLNRTPTPSADQVQAGLNLIALTNAKAKTADPKTMVDTSYVDALAKSGFIDSLYK